MWLFHWQLNIGAFYLCKRFITDNMHQALKYWYNYTYPAAPIKNPCDMALCWCYKDGLKSLLNFNILMCWVMLILLWNNISWFAFLSVGLQMQALLAALLVTPRKGQQRQLWISLFRVLLLLWIQLHNINFAAAIISCCSVSSFAKASGPCQGFLAGSGLV